MSVVCGWASQSEKGTANGKKGDQTEKEVKTGYYYNFGQDEIIRMKNVKKRKLAAKAMLAMCQNNNIGYGQIDRISLYNECVRINWDLNRIHEIKKCNTDCSMTVACAYNFAYKKAIIPSYVYTGNLRTLTVGKYPSRFSVITISKIKKPSADLRIADAPLKSGHHTIMVISR